MRAIRAAARRLVAACALAFLVTYAAHVAVGAHLSAPAPTPWVTDRQGNYLTQAGHEAAGRVEYGYWTTPPPPASPR